MRADTEHLLHMLRSQGRFCAGSGSPMYGELFELVAADVEAGGVFAMILSGHENAPSRQAVPLRLLGGLHRLVLDGRASELRRWYPSTGGSWDAGNACGTISRPSRTRCPFFGQATWKPSIAANLFLKEPSP